jgi:hypothetical protein
MRRITRRQALAGGGIAVAAGVAYWGRFALGGNFEQHVADQIGLEVGPTSGLLDSLRDELAADYDVRASGFLAATSAPTKWLMPHSVRKEAMQAFIGPLFGVQQSFVTPLVYAGLRKNTRYEACHVLVRG